MILLKEHNRKILELNLLVLDTQILAVKFERNWFLNVKICKNTENKVISYLQSQNANLFNINLIVFIIYGLVVLLAAITFYRHTHKESISLYFLKLNVN